MAMDKPSSHSQSYSHGYGTYGPWNPAPVPPSGPRTLPCAHTVVPLALVQSAAAVGADEMPNGMANATADRPVIAYRWTVRTL